MDIDKSRNSILVIGAGGVGSAFVRKALQYPNWFTPLHLASRSIDKCQILKDEFGSLLAIHQLDADDSEQVFELIQRINATLVVNLALPYQDLSIMDACLRARVDYIDTANYEPIDEAKFCYKWQWDYRERFEETGNMAILGTGFDPGVTNVFCQYANTHLFDTLHTVDIVDCNAGDHGHPFATNFNPEINIREITQNGKYYHQGQWIEVDSLSESMEIDFPEVGPRKAYLIYHEELESLVKNIPEIQTMRFWMTFSDAYLTHLEVLQNVGLTSIEPMSFQGQDVVPLQFLKACLPDPGALGSKYTGKTSIGCLFKGRQGGKEKAVSIYNVCDHEQCYKDIKAHAVSFTTAIPALITTKLIRTGIWKKPGVFNIEEFDPDPFIKEMPNFGLQWEVREDV